MKATSVKPSIQEAVDASRQFLFDRAANAVKADERELYRHLQGLAESVEELASLQEDVKIQLEEVRHAMGLHLERSGPVPHTRRR